MNVSARLIQQSRSVITKFINSLYANYKQLKHPNHSKLTLVITLNSHGPETEPSPSHHAFILISLDLYD